ncbi:MAG: translation initiation factor IF-3 [Planctomycetes bacterium]|nr:translation initiation factor IF-3 [Planctomycetota bacterium]
MRSRPRRSATVENQFSGGEFIPPPRFRNLRLPPKKGPRIIQRPRPGQIRVIGDDGKQLGIMEIADALALAEEKELDLVEIAPTAEPPTCKLMDYGKFKYQQTRKVRSQKKHAIRRKEVKVRPKTEEHDLNVKIERARRFLAKGHKVLVTMVFRGREAVYMDQGKDLLMTFAKALEDCAKLEKEPSREGRNKVDMILVSK